MQFLTENYTEFLHAREGGNSLYPSCYWRSRKELRRESSRSFERTVTPRDHRYVTGSRRNLRLGYAHLFNLYHLFTNRLYKSETFRGTKEMIEVSLEGHEVLSEVNTPAISPLKVPHRRHVYFRDHEAQS